MQAPSPWNFSLPKDEAVMTLPAGTKLFAVVDRLDSGTSGPYFYEPGLAIFWHFHTNLTSMLPRTENGQGDFNLTRDEHLEIIDEKLTIFGGGNWHLLEYVVPPAQTLIFPSTMVDANPVKAVYYPYSNGSSELTHVNVSKDNYTSALKQRLALPKRPNDVFYHGMLFMISPVWYKPLFLKQATFESIRDMFEGSRFWTKDSNGMSAYTNITAVGIHIKSPQDLFDVRTLYRIKWHLVWRRFLALRQKDADVEEVRQSFRTLGTEWVELSHVQGRPPPYWFDVNLITHIATHITNLKDLIAFGTSSQFLFSRMYRSPKNYMFQQLVLRKFLPCWSECFGVLKNQVLNQDVLGMPVSKGNGLWSINSIIFREDIPFEVAPISLIEYHQLRQAAAPLKKIPGMRDPSSILSNQQDMEFIVLTRKLDQLTSAREFLDLVRQCNSFLLLFSLHWACSHFTAISLPEDVGVRSPMEGSPDGVNFKTSRIVHPPMTNTLNTGPLKLFGSSSSVDPNELIDGISPFKSWMNEVLIPPFFLDPSFGDSLKRLKSLEKQRWKLMQYPLEQVKAGGPKYQAARFDALRHNLFFYRGDLLLGYLEISLRGISTYKVSEAATCDQYRIDMFRCVVAWEHVDEEFQRVYSDAQGIGDNGPGGLIRTLQHRYFQEAVPAKSLNRVYNYYKANQVHAEWYSMHPEVVATALDCSLSHYDIFRPSQSGARFYPMYMILSSLIRLFLYYGFADRAQWKTGF